MTLLIQRGLEIVPGYTLVRRVGSGMAGEVWVARASGGVHVAIKIIRDMDMVGSKRELGALRIVREVKHTNLCPLIGVWFFDRDGELLSNSATDEILGRESSLIDTAFVAGSTDKEELRATPSMNIDSDESSFAETSDLSAYGSDLSRGNQGENAPDDSSESCSEVDSLGGARQMVVAMGLGDRTLYDRLIEMRAPGNMPEEGDPLHLPGGIPVKELLQYIAGSASAIDELNFNHNIYHCDIKPQNILVVGGNAQVCDFGLARRVQENRRTQLAIGTPAYGAPEMLFDQTYTKTIDQYSLAITYYELRTGKLPFETTRRSMFLRAKAQGELLITDISAAEQEVVEKATHLEPELRYSSCTEFVEALTEAVYAKPKVNRKYAKWSIVAATGFVVAGATSVLYFREPETTPAIELNPKVQQAGPDKSIAKARSTSVNDPKLSRDLEVVDSESINPPTEMVAESDIKLDDQTEEITPEPLAMSPAEPEPEPKRKPAPQPTLADHIAQATSLAQQLVENEGAASKTEVSLSPDLVKRRRSLMNSLDMVFGNTQKTGWQLIDDSVRPFAITVAGQIHWNENRVSEGLKNWISIQDTPSLLTAVPADWRHRVASQTTAWLIDNSKVDDQNITEHRYAQLAVRANGILRLARQFASDSKELLRQIDVEQLLVAGAENNTLAGLDIWESLNLSKSECFPQVGYALAHLASARLAEAKQRDERIELINLSLLASNLQRNRSSEATVSTEEASVRWQNLSENFDVFTEVLERKPDQLPTWDTGIDSAELARFSEDYVDHACVSLMTVDHDEFIDLLRNIELAASIAAISSTTPETRSSMLLVSAEAFLRQHYEQTNDVPTTELVGRLRSYGKLINTNRLMDRFTLGCIADQNGLLSRDAKKMRSFYDEARELYSYVVNERTAPADIRGSAARCRASLLTRIAAIADTENKEALLRTADDDAQLALKLPQRWHFDTDDRLTTAAEVNLSMVRLLGELTTTERHDLLDDADQYLRQAIAEREKRAFPSVPQAVLRLNGYLLELVKPGKEDRRRQRELLAQKWMAEVATEVVRKETADSKPLVARTIDSKSSRLRCHWHCMCSMVLSSLEQPAEAMSQIEYAYQIAFQNLDSTDDRRHFATLILVQLKSLSLVDRATNGQRQDPQLIDELKQLLNSIVDPKPDFQEKQKLYLNELENLAKQ